jgi:putative addiction module killer protein
MSHVARGYEVREFLRADGTSPFRDWMDELPVPIRARIAARVVRFEAGNLGDAKTVGNGVWEARLMFGPGYRLYFGIVGGRLVLLLVGGDKKTQRSDIAVAKRYWQEFLEVQDG